MADVTNGRCPTPDDSFQRLSDLLAPARELAVSLVPRLADVSLDGGGVPPLGAAAEGTFRTLDAAGAAASLPTVDRVLDSVHDIAVAVLQVWLDQLAGKACPLIDQNRQLAELVMDRADRYGLGLYREAREQCVRVRLEATRNTPRTQRGDTLASQGGTFKMQISYDPSLGQVPPGFSTTCSVKFPHLVVARSVEQARAVFQSRAGKRDISSAD